MSLRTQFILDLGGNLAAKAQQYTAALRGMSTSSSNALKGLQRTVAEVGKGLDSLGNQYTAILGGAVGAGRRGAAG